MSTAARQLKFGAGTGNLEDNAVVAGVVVERAGLKEADPIAVEGNDLL